MAKEISTLLKSMELLRKRVYAELPIQQISILLLVADNPGITLPEIAKKLSMEQASTSRNVKALGTYVDRQSALKDKKAATQKGHQLVRTEPDLYNRRSLACYLTRHGEEVVKQLQKTMAPLSKVA